LFQPVALNNLRLARGDVGLDYLVILQYGRSANEECDGSALLYQREKQISVVLEGREIILSTNQET
jgi:hypothetical protein